MEGTPPPQIFIDSQLIILQFIKNNTKQSLESHKPFQIMEAIRQDTLTSGLKYSLATGNWGSNKKQAAKSGVAQVLNRLTYSSTLSHLRRLNTPIGREGLFHSLYKIIINSCLPFCERNEFNTLFFLSSRQVNSLNQDNSTIPIGV
jgi:hypothetical protein